ncbi:MAG: 3-oxoacyl-ACP reductase FabG [Verrucomicrobiales bacterium]|nr:3-oxoacyl-ACP reductase FabG [Verrucomicrobiales bacterium]
MRLKDKIVLVTGASKGIGRALALGMASERAHVVVNYHSDAKGAREVVEQIRKLDRRSIQLKADVSQVAQVRKMFDAVRREFGRLDVLVNNAAITGWSSFFEASEALWNRVLDTNLKGTFFCSLEAAKLMRDHGGSIVNVSTNCAALGVKNLSVYAASKGGIHALTKQLAVELAPCKIRVNTFAPGPTQVERNLKDDPDYDRAWGAVVPLGRTARPEEMVGAAIFLASDDSSFMTGQIFYVDGGWSAAGRIPEANLDRSLRKHAPAARKRR